jgi:hypothetical protein
VAFARVVYPLDERIDRRVAGKRHDPERRAERHPSPKMLDLRKDSVTRGGLIIVE